MTVADGLRALAARRDHLVARLSHPWGRPAALRRGLVVAAVALAAALPLLDPPLLTTEPASDFPTTLFSVAVTVLAALGLNVVVGHAGLLDLGYVGFYAVGAYTVAVFGSPASALATRYPFLVCVPIAVVLSMLAGVVLGAPTLRVRGDYLAIVTLGFGEIVRLTILNSSSLGGAGGISAVPRPPGRHADGTPVFGILDATPFYWLALAAVLGVVTVTRALTRSRVGRAWGAIREDEEVAELMGVPTFRFKLWAFTVGAAVGGLSGTLFASKQAFINPQSFPILTSVLFLAAVVVGGAGNPAGVVAGAVLIAYLPERFRFLAEYRVLAFGLALVVMSVFRPQGLLPGRHRLPAGLVPAADPTAVPTGVPTGEAADEASPGARSGDGAPRLARPVRHDVDPARPLLELDRLTVRFGGLTALDEVSFTVGHGEILGLIGPNGAGKTTCFNVVTGVYRPGAGRVLLGGRPLGRRRRHEITRLGIARTFQSIRLFPDLSALENVRVGADSHHRSSVPGVLLRAVRYRRRPGEFHGPPGRRRVQRLVGISRHAREELQGRARALELLAFVGIADRAHEPARALPYGYQRRLEIARALATDPVLLCLDEPAAGSNPAERAELRELIRRVRDAGYAVLLIEHDMRLVMGVTDRIVVLDLGRVIATGTPAEIRDDPRVVAAYLGDPDEDDEEDAG